MNEPSDQSAELVQYSFQSEPLKPMKSESYAWQTLPFLTNDSIIAAWQTCDLIDFTALALFELQRWHLVSSLFHQFQSYISTISYQEQKIATYI